MLIFAGEFKIRAAAGTQSDWSVDFDLCGARAASSASWRFQNFQRRAAQRRSAGRNIEAEADRVGNHAGELADFELDTNYFGVAETPGYRVNDTFSDRKFVHCPDPRKNHFLVNAFLARDVNKK